MSEAIDEMRRQRKIGKEIMIARAVRLENEEAFKTGLGFIGLSAEKLAGWSDLSEAEIESIVNGCAHLSFWNMGIRVTRTYENEYKKNHPEKGKRDLLKFRIAAFQRYLPFYVEVLISDGDKTRVPKILIEDFKENYPGYDCLEEDDDIIEMMDYYTDALLESIKDVLAEGYDKAVVAEMMDSKLQGIDISSHEQLKQYI